MWGSIVLKVATWFGGTFFQAAVDAYKVHVAAQGTEDARAADLAARELALETREAELNSQLLITEQGNWITRWVRPAWALPFVFWTWKVVIWDLSLGLGSTPELKGFVASLGLMVCGSYFGGRTIEKCTGMLTAWYRRRA